MTSRLLIIFTAVGLTVSSSRAETNIWQGGAADGPTRWELGANWSAGKPPSTGDGMDVVIPFRGQTSFPTLSTTATVDACLTLASRARLSVDSNATLTVKGDLVFNGATLRNTMLLLKGDVLLLGNIVSDGSAACRGKGEGWVRLAGDGPQSIVSTAARAVLPPLSIANTSAPVTLKSNIACAGLRVETNCTLDAQAADVIAFGGPGSGFCRGLLNEGILKGAPALEFFSGCYKAKLQLGGSVASGLTLDTGHYAHHVTLLGDAAITGDVRVKTGTLSMGNHTLTVDGSLFFSPFPEKPASGTASLQYGKEAAIVFKSSRAAVVESGGPDAAYYYSTDFPSIVVDKQIGTLTIHRYPLIPTGAVEFRSGTLDMSDGGALWLGAIRDRKHKIQDVAMEITSTITPDVCPEITPAPIPEMTPGEVRIVHQHVGPDVPSGTVLTNVAPTADIRSVPYMSMVRNLVDPDDNLRTTSQAERKGIPAKGVRYDLHFGEPRDVVEIEWAHGFGTWAILADKDGDGTFETLVRADFEGRIKSPKGGIWTSRQWIHNTFQPAVKAYGIQLVNPVGTLYVYDLQVLCRMDQKRSTGGSTASARKLPELMAAEALAVPAPASDARYLHGFHIEPWMFNVNGWLKMDRAKRPPLTEYKPFTNFVAKVKACHANVLNMWPPKTFADKRGKGTYETDLLWPSQYDKWSVQEDALQAIADAFNANGIELMTMGRCTYPQPLEAFPATDTRDEPAPYVTRHKREYLKGYVLEQVAQGVNGVGIGYDEQMGTRVRPKGANELTKAAFRARYGMEPPEEVEDTEAYRRWVVFGYEEFAAYLAEAAEAAKQANPHVWTKTATHVCLGNIWNKRIDVGIAEDIVGQKADIDYFRAYAYTDSANLGHYVSAVMTKHMLGANRDRGPASLHNCPWARDPDKHPGYYTAFTPAYMYGPPIASIMHGGRMPLYWRQNFIYHGGYDTYVEQAYSILDTLAAWGALEAKVPGRIVVLKSRASEDWWQLRQRYGANGDSMDQTRGFLYDKWILELLLANGYPFRVYYLDQPESFAKAAADAELVILPFPYSMSQEAFRAVDRAARGGSRLLVFDRQGETDEWGNAYPAPLLADLIASKRAVFVDEDMTSIGQYPSVQAEMCETVDRLLGDGKVIHFDPCGNDVEFACLEKGERETFLSFINWTDRSVTVEAGVRLPEGDYQVMQRDLTGVRRTTLNEQKKMPAKSLDRFGLSLAPWEVKVLRVQRAR